MLLFIYYSEDPVCARGSPHYPFTSPLPHIILYLLVSFTFLFSSLLFASSIFVIIRPFPVYQNSPTPFPGPVLDYPMG